MDKSWRDPDFQRELGARRKRQVRVLIEAVKKAGKDGLTKREACEQLDFSPHELKEALRVAKDEKFRVRAEVAKRRDKAGRLVPMTVYVRGNGKPPPEVVSKREAEAKRRRQSLEEEKERRLTRDRAEAERHARLQKV